MKLTSTRQLAANRANARKSTGPKTKDGKQNSARNSVRHGFTGRFEMIGSEDKAEYRKLVAQIHEDHQPATVLEAMLIERMAQHHWLIQRAIFFQTRIQDEDSFNFFENFNTLSRYQAANERAFSRCLADFLKLRKETLKEENGFVSQQEPAQISEIHEANLESNAVHPVAKPKTRTAPAVGFESHNPLAVACTEVVDLASLLLPEEDSSDETAA